MNEALKPWTNAKIRIKEGWEGFGKSGRALGEPVWVEQFWLPVLWDDEENPEFHKLAGIDMLIQFCPMDPTPTPEPLDADGQRNELAKILHNNHIVASDKIVEDLLLWHWDRCKPPTPEVGEWEESLDEQWSSINAPENNEFVKRNVKSFIRDLLAAKTECKKCKELECQLDAWFTIFGTTQLSHAQARLEQAEGDAAKTGGEPHLRTLELDKVCRVVQDEIDKIKETDGDKVFLPILTSAIIAQAVVAHFARPVVSAEEIKEDINNWLSCGESRLTPDDVKEIAESIHHLLEGKGQK